jgi:peptidoglycan/LPS O-acetylase OafA/YrhL
MPELDSLRGVAILLVVYFHAFFWMNWRPEGAAGMSRAMRLLSLSALPGWAGVDLFFVLSGFLITGILIDSRARPAGLFFKTFYMRRALRILPLYYLVLFVVGAALLAYNEVSPSFLLYSVVYCSNIALMQGLRAEFPLVVIWSLAIEEQFYLVWPAVVKFLSARALLVILLVLCVGVPVIRALSFVHWGYVDKGLYFGTWFRFDSFAWGGLLALFVRSRLFTRKSFFILCAGLLGAAVVLGGAGARYGIATRTQLTGAALQFTLLSLVFAGCLGLLLLAGTSRYAWLVDIRPLRFFGRISYCLYLIHQFCFWTYDKTFAAFGLDSRTLLGGELPSIVLRACIVVAAAVGVSALSYRYFEAPILSLKNRYPTKTTAPEQSPDGRLMPAL